MKLVEGGCVKGYVYSTVDRAIDWRDVERHAKEAERKGYKVVKWRVEGEGAEHVQMFRGVGGAEEYWAWVGSVVRLGLGIEGERKEPGFSDSGFVSEA